MKLKTLVGVAICLTFLGCGSDDERLREKARLEGQTSSQAEIDTQLANREKLLEKARAEGRAAAEAGIGAQNANLSSKVVQMETDLESRHRFFEAMTGVYEGAMLSKEGDRFSVRFVLSSSMPRYPNSNRPRTIEELSFELNNLYMNAQVVEWSPVGADGKMEMAYGCIFDQVRPDLLNGKLFLISKGCESSYTIYLSEFDTKTNSVEAVKGPNAKSQSIASKVVSGQLPSVVGLAVEKQSNLSSRRFEFVLRRIERESTI